MTNAQFSIDKTKFVTYSTAIRGRSVERGYGENHQGEDKLVAATLPVYAVVDRTNPAWINEQLGTDKGEQVLQILRMGAVPRINLGQADGIRTQRRIMEVLEPFRIKQFRVVFISMSQLDETIEQCRVNMALSIKAELSPYFGSSMAQHIAENLSKDQNNLVFLLNSAIRVVLNASGFETEFPANTKFSHFILKDIKKFRQDAKVSSAIYNVAYALSPGVGQGQLPVFMADYVPDDTESEIKMFAHYIEREVRQSFWHCLERYAELIVLSQRDGDWSAGRASDYRKLLDLFQSGILPFAFANNELLVAVK